ncbi:MAG: hypothetical protein HC875_07395 [Anaerolineales bacterium]|nr:hypothetical protein [Anaerolineales bacterium]
MRPTSPAPPNSPPFPTPTCWLCTKPSAPTRATLAELLALAETLEKEYQAPENARFVREAASVYEARGLLRRG